MASWPEDNRLFFMVSMDISEEASRSVVWSDGSFSASMSRRLQVEAIAGNTRVLEAAEYPTLTCEFVLAQTPYREVRWQRIPQRPDEFKVLHQSSDAATLAPGDVIMLISTPFLLYQSIKC